MKGIRIELELLATGEHVEEVVELSPQLLGKALLELGYEIAILGPNGGRPPYEMSVAAGLLRAKIVEILP